MDFFVEVDDHGTGRALKCVGRYLTESQAGIDRRGGQLAGGNEQSLGSHIFEESAGWTVDEIPVADKNPERLGLGLDAL
ncbi:MAG: hypothetical protein O3C43_24945 [Verrucomicrobia bacterium]|nr:hypothetical protein [Verrucomicrobiota bacterium]MDA1069738.1 hypothetical protein [Verrucomicrobiota bacterium]